MSLLHFILRHGSSPPQDLHYTNDHTVGALMHTICQQLGLSTCKLIGLTKGKMPHVNTLLSDLPLSTTSPIKLMVIGTSSSVLEEQSTRDAVYEIERQAQMKAEQERAAREAEARRIWEEQEAARAAEEAERRARWAAENAIRERERAARYAEEEKQRIAREIAAENDVTATIAFQYPSFVSPEATSSEKIILPPSALQSIIDRKIAFPLTFQVEVIDSATSTTTSTPMETDTPTASSSSSLSASSSSSSSSTPIYLGVLDFSAPSSTIMIPASLQSRLGISEGATIRIHNVNIEAGISVKLQPLNRAWIRLSELERRALLELELRKGHHFITEGEILTFTYAHQVLRFRVIETKPSHIISLIDAQLQTEVMPFEDETAAATSTSSSSTSTSPSTPSSSSPDPSIPLPLTIGNPVDVEVKNDGYAYYELKHDDPNMAIVVDCKAISGDPDLYLIPSSTASLVASSLPSLTHFTWCSQSTRGSKSLTVDQSHAEFTVGSYILAVHAYGEDTKATCTFNTVPASQLSSTAGHTVGEADQKDAVKCENCLKFIPSRTYPMHSAQCTRINYRCDICRQVMLIRDKEKHQNLIHTKYPCTCGAWFDQSCFRIHLGEQCPDRLIECTYCPLRVRHADIGDHRRECGLRHSACNLCGASMQRKLQRRHQVQHGKEERQVTWKDYWQ